MDSLTKKVLDFWFSEEVSKKWFVKDEKLDLQIRSIFFDDHCALNDLSVRELLADNDLEFILARIIILDQFSRNLFRGFKESFTQDNKALELAKFIVSKGLDAKIAVEKKSFIYLPFMHSEDLNDQEKCVELFKDLGNKYSLDYAVRHRDIIKEFGRFAHRNEVLGRKSSKVELLFLTQSNSSF
jgi:uncharacterized protein (DUF924 family)